MRISTANRYDMTVDQLQLRQQSLSDSQLQLTTGKRVNLASDDPAAAARAERMAADEARNAASQRAVDASRNAMTLTESALGDANDLLQQARETLVAAGNGSYSTAERQIQANKLKELRSQLLAVANRSDGGAGFLFGGQGASSPPFRDMPGGVQYLGTSGQTRVSSGEALPITFDGAATWMQARTGNGVFETKVLASNGSAVIDSGSVTNPSLLTGSTYTVQFSVSGATTTYSVLRDGTPTTLTNVPYTSGASIGIDGLAFTITGQPANGDQFQAAPSTPSLSVFNALDKAITALSDPNQTSTSAAQAVNFGLRDVDAAMGRLQSARSEAGETLNRADGITNRLQAQTLKDKTVRSQAEDLDMVQAISSFQNQQTGYDAALKAYSMVQRLSLFQYINN